MFAPHRLLDLTAEDMDAEDLGIVVALSKSKAVTLRSSIMAANTKQDLIDGVVSDLCAALRIQQPERGGGVH